MIIEGKKDYGTGDVIMVSDGKTTLNEVHIWLKENYGLKPCDGHMEKRPASTFKGLENPEMWYFYR